MKPLWTSTIGSYGRSSSGVSRSRGGRQSKLIVDATFMVYVKQLGLTIVLQQEREDFRELRRASAGHCAGVTTKFGQRRSHRRCLHEGVVVSRGRHKQARGSRRSAASPDIIESSSRPVAGSAAGR